MGIGVQGETYGEVTEHSADSLDVHTVLECDGGEGAPQVMKSDLRDTGSFKDTLQHIIHAVRGDGTSIG